MRSARARPGMQYAYRPIRPRLIRMPVAESGVCSGCCDGFIASGFVARENVSRDPRVVPKGKLTLVVVIALAAAAGCTSGSPTERMGIHASLPLFLIPSLQGNPGFSGRYPKTIIFSGDGGNIVTGINWLSWGSSQAIGQGTWTYQDCIPTCAGGSHTPYAATITLAQPVGGRYTKLVETTTGPHAFSSVAYLNQDSPGSGHWPFEAN